MMKYIAGAVLGMLVLPAAAQNVAFQCKGEGYFDPLLDKSDKAAVEADIVFQKAAKDRQIAIIVKGHEVTAVGVMYPGPLSMRIAQRGTKENGWSFVRVVDGPASSPVHFVKINSFAGKQSRDGYTRYSFVYSMNGEATFGNCIQS